MNYDEFSEMVKSCIKVKPIQWLEGTGYDYTDGLPYQYEVWDNGIVRFRRHNTGNYTEVHCGTVDEGKRWCEIHNIDQVLMLIDVGQIQPAPQIDWSKAPEWAQYHAIDENGSAYWYEAMPLKFGTRWRWDAGRMEFDSHFNPRKNWRESLTKRPDAL